MGIFRKKLVTRMEDPVFGLITYEGGLWDIIPQEGGGNFMISIDAPPSGPSDLQRDFFQKVRSNLKKFQEQSFAFIVPRVGESVDIRRLHVYAVEVGTEADCSRGKFVLEFADEDANEIHRVIFDAGLPVDYGCDD
jgi:hypothetical protein